MKPDERERALKQKKSFSAHQNLDRAQVGGAERLPLPVHLVKKSPIQKKVMEIILSGLIHFLTNISRFLFHSFNEFMTCRTV